MVSSNNSYLIKIICLLTVLWFQIFISNPDNFQTGLFDWKGMTKAGQGGPGSNGNERVTLHTRSRELEPYLGM